MASEIGLGTGSAPPGAAATERPRTHARALRSRLYLLAIAAVAAVPILLFAAALVYDGLVSERAALQDSLWRASRDALGAIDRRLDGQIAALEAIAALIDEDGSDLRDLAAGPAAELRQRHGWKSVRLIDAGTHEVVASVDAAGEKPAWARMPEAIDALTAAGRPSALILPREIAGPDPDIVLRVPVRHEGRIDHVLTASIDSGLFSDLLEHSAIPPDWTAAAMDPAFRIAARNRGRELYLGTPITPSLRAQVERATEGFFFSVNKEGDRVYTLFIRSPVSGWTVAIGAPATAIEQPLFWSKLSIAASGGGAILIACLLAFFLVRNFEHRQAAEERVATLAAEAATERRLAEVASNLPGVIYRRVLHPDGTVSYPFVSGGGVERLFRLPPASLRQPMSGTAMADAVRFEQHTDLHAAMQRSARDLTPYKVEGTVRMDDGEVRWIRSTALPRRGDDGSIAWDGVALDVTDERRAEEQRQVLVAELNHRVRNTLAVVQALAASTLPRDAAFQVYVGRLRALAHAHALLAETGWAGASLARLVEIELAPYRGTGDGARATIVGDDLRLDPAAAQALILVVHELSTNAAKHGALSRPSGQVSVSWTVEAMAGGRQLRLVWSETGGPVTAPPERSGFGRVLIERSITHSLAGRVELDFRPEGLRCAIEIPLERVVPVA